MSKALYFCAPLFSAAYINKLKAYNLFSSLWKKYQA